MYWWNDKALAEDLKAGRLSSREKMSYFLAWTIGGSLFASFLIWYAEEASTLIIVADSLLFLIINIAGVVFCFQANQKGDDKDFIERMVCISWPLLFKFFALMIVLYVVYVIVGYITAGDGFDDIIEQYTVFDLAIANGSTVVYYLWIRSNLLHISSTSTQTGSLSK